MLLDTRNADLSDLVALLRSQADVKLDAVVPAQALRSVDGIIAIEGVTPSVPDTVEAMLSGDEGRSVGLFRPTVIADGDIATKLGIPLSYVRLLRNGDANTKPATPARIDLYDANVNGWLHGLRGDGETWTHSPDGRMFLARCFVDPDGGVGVMRALLSDSYKTIDHLDTLLAVLAGIKDGGIAAEITGCDLTERRMVVRIEAPEITAMAPTLLANYRSPYDSRPGSELPIISAGLVVANSETGGGAATITPRLVVQICKNGMTRTVDQLRNVHLGSKLDEGVIRWSNETQERNLELITAQTRDAVVAFLDQDYLDRVVGEIESKAGKPLENPAEAVKVLSQRLKFTETQTASILDCFIKSGDVTAGGYMQAVTAAAQSMDAETAYDFENMAFTALDAAFAL